MGEKEYGPWLFTLLFIFFVVGFGSRFSIVREASKEVYEDAVRDVKSFLGPRERFSER